MTLPAFIAGRLWLKVLLASSAVFVAAIGAITLVNQQGERALIVEQARAQGDMVARAIDGGMDDALAAGNNGAVQAQLESLGRGIAGLHVSVFDAEGSITFSTDGSARGKQASGFLEGPEARAALQRMLVNGETPRRGFRQEDGSDLRLAVLRPELNGQRCVQCHGDTQRVLGGMLLLMPIGKATRAARARGLLVGGSGLVGIVLLSWMMLARPLNRTVGGMAGSAEALGQGDLTARFQTAGSDGSSGSGNGAGRTLDEIGRLALDLNRFAERFHGMIRDIRESSEGVATAAQQLLAISEEISYSAGDSSERVSAVSSAMEQTAASLSGIATSTEQMTASISEISQLSENARRVTDDAVERSRQASVAIQDVVAAAGDINTISESIGLIARQTNLLALNATIEAARAGEVGRGFAVVAGEVKALSHQVQAANAEINARALGMREVLAAAVRYIDEVGAVVEEVNRMVMAVAAAGEEQAVTTGEIARIVNENSLAAAAVSSDVAALRGNVGDLAGGSAQVAESARELSRLAEELRARAARFRV